MRSLLVSLAAAAGLALALAPPATAHPAGEAGCFGMTFLGQVCPAKVVRGLGDDSAAQVQAGEEEGDGLELVAQVPKDEVFTATDVNSDLAFWGDHVISGNYKGFQIFDISKTQPERVAQVVCPGSQNDVSVWEDLIITSTDSARNTSACEANTGAATQETLLGNGWEGLRIFDWSNPAAPKLVTTVKTKCGSHTHTLVPDEKNNRVLAYVSSYGPGANANCAPPHDLISIVEIPLANPAAAKVLKEAVLFPLAEGLPVGGGGQASTSGCHDITAYPEVGLAAGACMGEGIIMDIKDPANPRKIATMTDPNFAFWHSATFSNDGKKVIFTDELGGGTAARCTNAYRENQGADALYDISNPTAPKLLSYFKIPRFQTTTENCVSHNGSLLPHPTRDLFVQSWYQGGTSVVDFTDPLKPKEVAFFDRGPINESALVTGGHWSSYWYNGLIYANEIYRGLDVLRFKGAPAAPKLDRLNAQTQERLPAFGG